MRVGKLLVVALLLCAAATGARADREKYSLQRFELSKISIWQIKAHADGKHLYALLRDPDGYIHHVEVGEGVGRGGRVIEIRKCEIKALELLPDGKGGWSESIRKLTLKDCKRH